MRAAGYRSGATAAGVREDGAGAYRRVAGGRRGGDCAVLATGG